MDKDEIGHIIKSRRIALNVKQHELADLAEVGINTLVAIERGKGNPNLDTLQSILRVLGLQIRISIIPAASEERNL